MALRRHQTGLGLCSCCEKPVLELQGQFARNGEELAHLRCLSRYGKAHAWNEETRRHLLGEGYQEAGRVDQIAAYWNPWSGSVWLLWENGYRVQLGVHQLPEDFVDLHQLSTLSIRQELELELGFDVDFANELVRTLYRAREIPLARLLDFLQIKEEMSYGDEVLGGARLCLNESRPSEDGRLYFDLSYRVYLSPDAVTLVHQLDHPRYTFDSVLRRNSHLRELLERRTEPISSDSRDALVEFLCHYWLAHPVYRSSAELEKALPGRGRFQVRLAGALWTVDPERHLVESYRATDDGGGQIVRIRTDLFLRNLLRQLWEEFVELAGAGPDDTLAKIDLKLADPCCRQMLRRREVLIPNSVHDVLSEFLCFFDAAGYLYESTSELERQLREGGNFEFRLKGESWFVEPASHRATLEAGTV